MPHAIGQRCFWALVRLQSENMLTAVLCSLIRNKNNKNRNRKGLAGARERESLGTTRLLLSLVPKHAGETGATMSSSKPRRNHE